VTDQVLLISRIALLALVYLVFLRVARAVIVEIRAEGGNPPQKVHAKTAASHKSARVAAGVGPGAATASPSAAAPQRSRHRLEVRAPKSATGQVFELVGETTIGRASGCAVSIDDSRVSKIHARLFPDANRWIIEDLKSTNGTSVNGERIDMPRVLGAGDLIQVGEVVMEFA